MAALTAASIKARLIGNVGARDENHNITLARDIARSGNATAATAVVDILVTAPSKIQQDAIKVLYEIGATNPLLIAGHLPVFLHLMHSKNNRLIWGCLTAINTICSVRPGDIYPYLNDILRAAAAGSVIAKDQAVNILVCLAKDSRFIEQALPPLFEQLQICAINQLPMYAEKATSIALTHTQATHLAHVLTNRLHDPLSPPKRRRVETVIRKVTESKI